MVHIDLGFMLGHAPGGITFEKPQARTNSIPQRPHAFRNARISKMHIRDLSRRYLRAVQADARDGRRVGREGIPSVDGVHRANDRGHVGNAEASRRDRARPPLPSATSKPRPGLMRPRSTPSDFIRVATPAPQVRNVEILAASGARFPCFVFTPRKKIITALKRRFKMHKSKQQLRRSRRRPLTLILSPLDDSHARTVYKCVLWMLLGGW